MTDSKGAEARRKKANDIRMKMQMDAVQKYDGQQCHKCTPWSKKGVLIIGKGYKCKHGDYIPYVKQG